MRLIKSGSNNFGVMRAMMRLTLLKSNGLGIVRAMVRFTLLVLEDFGIMRAVRLTLSKSGYFGIMRAVWGWLYQSQMILAWWEPCQVDFTRVRWFWHYESCVRLTLSKYDDFGIMRDWLLSNFCSSRGVIIHEHLLPLWGVISFTRGHLLLERSFFAIDVFVWDWLSSNFVLHKE